MTKTPYVELHAHSNFSLLDGACHPEALVERAAELGMAAVALTDHNAVYGAPRFVEAARIYGLQPIYGAELTLAGGFHLTLLVENETGWGNLCRLISLAQHNAPKGEAVLLHEKLADHTTGLMALSGCRQGEVATSLRAKDYPRALAVAQRYRDWFGPDHFWLELQHHLLPEDNRLRAELVDLAQRLDLGYVATNNVHYLRRKDRQLQDVLVCIRHQLRLAEATAYRRPNAEFYLKSARRMAHLFAAYPEALSNTLRIAERCNFRLQYGLQDLPPFPTPPGLAATTYLRRLCEQALPRRYPAPPSRVKAQLSHELAVIDRAKLSNYFLMVWDLVRFARTQGIGCQGRGSAANSLVAYLLHISPVDPLAHDLVFERFLSAERQGVPDIDIDFDAQRREEVIQYVYQKYGDQAAMACTFVTFRARSALRDIAKVLDLAPEVATAARQALDGDLSATLPSEEAESIQWLVELARQIQDFPRHVGLHNGGMVIAANLARRIPTEPATMTDRVVVQWDKEGLEHLGLVKFDILGLRMISAITEAALTIKQTSGHDPKLDHLTFDDPAVYQMIAQADTLGVFQVESRAQAQMLPRFKPRCFNDLIVAISLIRPGPIQGNMVHPYLRRRLGLEPVVYLHPLLEPALAETLGVILFQEQCLKVARDLAGFTAGQGEQLRRALGSKRGEAAVARFRTAFLAGAGRNGVPTDIAETVFDQLSAFGSYAFAKSHAAAFAVLVYQSAWLKRYHPAAFLTALLNNQPMGFWSPAVLVGQAQRQGAQVLAVDVHDSQWLCIVTADGVRLGFNYVHGLGETGAARLITARRSNPFNNLADFCRRTQLARRWVEHLIRAGAMARWGTPRRQLLWELGTLHYREDALDLTFPTEAVALPNLSEAEAALMEREVLGLSTGDHVMTRYRPWLDKQGIFGSEALGTLPDGQRVWVAGLLVVHQAPPTAKGFHFLTLEDEDGLIDVVFRPQIYAEYRRLLRSVSLLIVEGILQREETVISIVAEQAGALPVNR